jgi:hypothetical protein
MRFPKEDLLFDRIIRKMLQCTQIGSSLISVANPFDQNERFAESARAHYVVIVRRNNACVHRDLGDFAMKHLSHAFPDNSLLGTCLMLAHSTFYDALPSNTGRRGPRHRPTSPASVRRVPAYCNGRWWRSTTGSTASA